MNLTHSTSVRIRPLPPFDFDSSLHKPDHFPSRDNDWEPGVRHQTMRWEGHILGLKIKNSGSVDRPAIDLQVFSAYPLDPGVIDRLAQEITFRCCFQLDLQPFYDRLTGHPMLDPVFTRWRGMRPLNMSSLYEYLIISIVLQNTVVRRSISMMQTLFEHFGEQVTFDGRDFFSFWLPQDLIAGEQELRDLKMGYRAKSIRRVTDTFSRGELDENHLRLCSLEEQRLSLLSLYGIGPASVGYLMFDVFHHMDEMQHISPWEQKIYSKLFFDRDPEDPAPVSDLIAFFDLHFSGYRALAVHYIWEDLWWQRHHAPVEWLEKLIRR